MAINGEVKSRWWEGRGWMEEKRMREGEIFIKARQAEAEFPEVEENI